MPLFVRLKIRHLLSMSDIVSAGGTFLDVIEAGLVMGCHGLLAAQ